MRPGGTWGRGRGDSIPCLQPGCALCVICLALSPLATQLLPAIGSRPAGQCASVALSCSLASSPACWLAAHPVGPAFSKDTRAFVPASLSLRPPPVVPPATLLSPGAMATSSARPAVLALAGLALLLLLCLGPGKWWMPGRECWGCWGRRLEMMCYMPAYDPALSLG